MDASLGAWRSGTIEALHLFARAIELRLIYIKHVMGLKNPSHEPRNMGGEDNPTEETRLLDNEGYHVDDVGQENGHSDRNDGQSTDNVPLAKEANSWELLAVLASTWVGVFFAALGTH